MCLLLNLIPLKAVSPNNLILFISSLSFTIDTIVIAHLAGTDELYGTPSLVQGDKEAWKVPLPLLLFGGLEVISLSAAWVTSAVPRYFTKVKSLRRHLVEKEFQFSMPSALREMNAKPAGLSWFSRGVWHPSNILSDQC